MVSRSDKDNRKPWHRQHLDLKLAFGVIIFFALATGVYLVANFEALVPSLSLPATPAASIVVSKPAPEKTNGLAPFLSADDFKSYLDDGRRACGDGIFEAQNLSLAGGVGQQTTTPAVPVKTVSPGSKSGAAKSQKIPADTTLTAADAARYLSLGSAVAAGGADIIETDNSNIYFSAENQYLPPKGSDAGEDEEGGETKIIRAFSQAAPLQISSIPQKGNLLLAASTLVAVSGNSISAFKVDDPYAPVLLWRARINEGSEVVVSKWASGKLYLAMRTKIDAASPCPIKPISQADKPFVIDCDGIWHPQTPVFADSIFTIFKIDPASGGIEKNISFVGDAKGSAVLVSDGAVYAAWLQAGDYTAFFGDFLADKCKSLLPNYLLEKAAKLPGCGMSLASKELELRVLISNWISSLGQAEQTRVTGEISRRLDDYLAGHYRDFEQTGIAKIDPGSFGFVADNLVSGRLVSPRALDEYGGKLRLVTVSGRGAAQKMLWLVTGNAGGGDPDKVVNNAYVLDANLAVAGAAENMDLPAEICALRYDQDIAYAATCRPADPFYVIGFETPSGVGKQGQLAPPAAPAYLRPLPDKLALAAAKNSRKIKLALFDVSIAAKPEKISELDLNDYWADLDANYPAFASDGQNKLFFLPVAKGGYIFSYAGGKITLKKAVGNFAVSRAFFTEGALYLAGDDGMEIYGGADWARTGAVKF